MGIIHRLGIIKIDDCEGDSSQEKDWSQRLANEWQRAWKFMKCAEEGTCVKNPKRSSYIRDRRTWKSKLMRCKREERFTNTVGEQPCQLTVGQSKWKCTMGLCMEDFSSIILLEWKSKIVILLWIDLKNWKVFSFFVVFVIFKSQEVKRQIDKVEARGM